jgi:probable addiction module antidote protein
MPAFFVGEYMSEKFGKLPIGPRPHPRESADHLNHAFETSDIAKICKAIAVVTHSHNMSDIAKKAGIQRSSLYRAFADSPKHPNFTTVLSVLDAMGFQLHVTARGGERATPARLATCRRGLFQP